MYNTKFRVSTFSLSLFFFFFMLKTGTHTCRHTDQPLKMQYSDSRDLKTCKSVKISV